MNILNQKIKIDFKIKLTKLLLEKSYKQEKIEELFEFINLFLSFNNEKYDNLFYEDLEKMPKTKEKESLNSFEKFLLKKGKKQSNNEIAINMLKNNEPVKKVSTYTGLTMSEVEELKNNLK